jgi:glycosyltransferase involved in cell wall biosynthesis
MLKVGINMLFLGEGAGGVGRYAAEIAGALAERGDVELTLFTSRDEPLDLRSRPWAARARFTQLPVTRSSRAGYLAATFGAVPALAAARRLDVLHSPANVGPVFCPGVACVITVHDMIWMRAGDQWDSEQAREAMRRSSQMTVPRARRVITDSESSAADISSMLGIMRGRIDVAPLGARVDSAAAATPEADLRGRFALGQGPVILCVAQKRPYKRQDTLIRALADLPAETQLVLPGAATEFEDELRALARDLGVAERVKFPDWVTEADLEGIYRLASCFALPSELEGFGLPVLEAMARGLPVACSDRTSLPEVAGQAALLFDPDDQAAVTHSLSELIEDQALRTRLIAAGLERAADFTWARTAEATVASYRKALKGNG